MSMSTQAFDGCWLASQALLRYYARAALLQVQARRVTAKDWTQFPKRAVVIGSGVKVGIAGPHIRWKFDALLTLRSSHLVLKPRQHFSSNFAGETGCQQERFQLLQEACVALQDCMAAPGSCHGGIVCAMVETPDVGDSSPINNMMGINMH